MALSTMRLAVRRLVDDDLLGDALTVVWHAGEPLVLPASYYEEAFDAIDEELGGTCEVEHSIQTNATLIDDAWCAFLSRRGVRVGVSVDGREEWHDRYRRSRNGKGTHARVRDGMARLRAAGVSFHAIAVVTDASVGEPDAFVDWFASEGFGDVGCNFDEVEGGHSVSSIAGLEVQHSAFFARLLERTAQADSAVQIRELALARMLVERPLPTYRWRDRQWPDNPQVIPFALISVAHDGRFSTFSPELLGQRSGAFGDFAFGNVSTDPYWSAVSNPGFVAAWDAIVRGVMACDDRCAHFGYCGGGSPVNKLYELGDMSGTETLYCRATLKRPFDAVLALAERTVADHRAAAMAERRGERHES